MKKAVFWYKKAAELFLKSAQGGDGNAAANLGYYYDMGHSGAVSWLKQYGEGKGEE